MQCDGMGYAGKGGDGADIRLFTKSECDKLGGNWSGNGECLKKEGGSWSWDCRNAAMPSAFSSLMPQAGSSSTFLYIGAAVVAAYLLMRR